MSALTLTIIIGIFVLIVATPLIALFVVARMPDEEPRHTLDCLDWRQHGQRDITCTAHHGTDWFGPRAQVELQDAFDGQMGFGK